MHHEYEGGIEKSVPRITNWNHETCRVMTIGDRDGRIFLSDPHTNYGFFFQYIFYIEKKNRKKTTRKS